MRIIVVAGLAVGAMVVFAPEQGAGVMRSVVHGFGWGIGREIAHSFFGHRHWGRRSRSRLERWKRTGERTSSSGSETARIRPEPVFVASTPTGGVDV